jgi:biopolymer transport protein ExbD
MSFRRAKGIRRKLMLFPLMDVFFILLIFFLAIAAIKFELPHQWNKIESTECATPVPDVGETHVLVQLDDDGSHFTWLDYDFRDSIQQYGRAALEHLTFPIGSLGEKARDFRNRAGMCSARLINVAIRCPNNLPYGTVWKVQKTIREGIEGEGSPTDISQFAVHFSLLPGSLAGLAPPALNERAIYLGFRNHD